ncbi:MAG TPA: crosslink repair DNA glycosylase YcaQ family protein [Candidatus Bathyarchaeia archaeon]|nr:crosslink repair DNA glycosylase YcaQ family protein [Candidatus Bathyarchaeia archaeon]
MSKATISIPGQVARRLAVTKQHLAGKLPAKATREHILSVVRDLTFVQWDPIAVVAPSHVLSFWNRVGDFPISDLERLLWDEKRLFLHWVNFAASIVLTEDYPLYYSMMKRYPESIGKSWGQRKPRTRKYIAEHKKLRESILNQLKSGPLQQTQFKEYVRTKSVDGWSTGSEVSRMLFHMEMSGEVMITGHQANRNIWTLSEMFLPEWVEKEDLEEEEVERVAAQKAIRALGTASPREINYYFPRGRYENLKKTLEHLQGESMIHQVHVVGLGGNDERYVHDLDIGLLESLQSDAWQPRVSLLPPFDNLLTVRGWTSRIFDFKYALDMFFPEEKRKFGYYVLPILWGDKLIGRVDPRLDRQKEKLLINSVHAEPGSPSDKEVASMIKGTIERLAEFLGAKEVVYSARVPKAWRMSLH